jgi:4,4'-diaponeurosporenoate glycosyltransferase
VRYVGKFGKFMPLLHVVSTLFFLLVLLYSSYQVAFRGSVTWKGRDVQVGSRGDR